MSRFRREAADREALRLRARAAVPILASVLVRVIEGSPGGPSSHQDLLRGMALPLPDVRPPVLSKDRLGPRTAGIVQTRGRDCPPTGR